MSRIGRKPIPLPKGVEVKIDGSRVSVKGSKGILEMDVMPQIKVEQEDAKLVVTRESEIKTVRAAHGMTRAILNNMVTGVSSGFEKVLEIVGVGYRAQMQGKNLVLSLGFSHPVEVEPPAGIEFACESPIKIVVRGIDRQLVGQVASNIREYRPPEPYKGKGIRYSGEFVIRKAGKAGAKK
ncbi:MAG TPA: 50S ribosomal protein L6 [Synergistaceae bacterium]|uniref:50S ribosomal protein L6 n=1 Tax=Synergistaceae TaxID=649777 RepID=UPI000EE52964|nr:50S ribosomal protein L6 [Synergistaceae bacterium DZ-S4]HAH69139.1 50S ribosomal protein L6 [Synergistaceae bacterium]